MVAASLKNVTKSFFLLESSGNLSELFYFMLSLEAVIYYIRVHNHLSKHYGFI